MANPPWPCICWRFLPVNLPTKPFELRKNFDLKTRNFNLCWAFFKFFYFFLQWHKWPYMQETKEIFKNDLWLHARFGAIWPNWQTSPAYVSSVPGGSTQGSWLEHSAVCQCSFKMELAANSPKPTSKYNLSSQLNRKWRKRRPLHSK